MGLHTMEMKLLPSNSNHFYVACDRVNMYLKKNYKIPGEEVPISS